MVACGYKSGKMSHQKWWWGVDMRKKGWVSHERESLREGKISSCVNKIHNCDISVLVCSLGLTKIPNFTHNHLITISNLINHL
jgi:hypothetical protein